MTKTHINSKGFALCSNIRQSDNYTRNVSFITNLIKTIISTSLAGLSAYYTWDVLSSSSTFDNVHNYNIHAQSPLTKQHFKTMIMLNRPLAISTDSPSYLPMGSLVVSVHTRQQ